MQRLRGGDPVALFATEQGLLITGGSDAVTEFIDRLMEQIGDKPVVRHPTPDDVTGASPLRPLAKTRGEYVEFSSRAMAVIKEKKLIPSAAGHFRSLVAKKGGSAGGLVWKSFEPSTAKVLALQGAVVQVALKLAIREVSEAIERVEGKVDKLLKLARAERLGSVKGDRRLLEPMARRAAESGAVSKSDWSTVSHLGVDILRGIESFREFIAEEAADSVRPMSARGRNAELKDLTSEMLRESLALLVAAEDNYLQWVTVRVANVKANEPDALADTLQDAQTVLEQLSSADQHLIDSIHTSTLELLRPSGWESLTPFKRRQMYDQGEEIEQELAWFAAQRHLDAPAIEAEFPTLKQAIDHALSRFIKRSG